jgi:formate--tetrahydrofolate ligase
MAMAKLAAEQGKTVITAIREPSMGPVFGIKGGAAGGGYSQVLPMEDINLHFTGDIHAIGAANNLLAAMLDNQMFHPTFRRKNPLNIDPSSISWNRVVDLNDSALTNVKIGTVSKKDINGYPRDSGYDITVASEIMAILALATDLKDLRRRLGRIVPAYTHDGKPVTADDIKAAGAMTVVLKDALMPNLVQTLEHTPAIMHCGPFANIAQGNNSIIADKMALKLADYVLTESGFGADMGAEKFLNIKCRKAGYAPSCIILVATIRALKLHGDAFDFPPGKTPPKELLEGENVEAVKKGCVNMIKHIENMKKVEAVKEIALQSGADAAEAGDFHARGGEGAMDIGRAVIKACEQPSDFKLLYPDDVPIKQKIETIAKEIYGADGVEYSEEAEKKIAMFEELGYGNLPMCMQVSCCP